MDFKENLSILNHFLVIYVERVKNGSFLKPAVLRFEPRLMRCRQAFLNLHIKLIHRSAKCGAYFLQKDNCHLVPLALKDTTEATSGITYFKQAPLTLDP